MNQVIPAATATPVTARELAHDLMLYRFEANGAFRLRHIPLLLVNRQTLLCQPRLTVHIFIFDLQVLELLVWYPHNAHVLNTGSARLPRRREELVRIGTLPASPGQKHARDAYRDRERSYEGRHEQQNTADLTRTADAGEGRRAAEIGTVLTGRTTATLWRCRRRVLVLIRCIRRCVAELAAANFGFVLGKGIRVGRRRVIRL